MILSDENDYRSLCGVFPATVDGADIAHIIFIIPVCFPGLLPEPGTFLTGESYVNPLVYVFSWLAAVVMGGIWFAWMLELNGLAIF
ncbi:hypothetical protein DM919_16255 [Salmonella enterica]|nr:hypothetical protein [Salmonella enterica]